MDGRQPLWPNSAMEKHIRPAALHGGVRKRIEWHTQRHTIGTLLTRPMARTWRRCNPSCATPMLSVTEDRYVQAMTPAKRQAQREIMGLLDLNGPTPEARNAATH